jgi:glycine/D-amino acid oxidase-like deaminating enzyme
MQPTASRTVAIIGAGPVGLAAAAHAAERGLQPVVFETGPAAGHAAQRWGHVRMFSPWAYNIDKACERLLSAVGWNAPEPEAYPTGAETRGPIFSPACHEDGACSAHQDFG